ncbi:MAG: signal peptide peptidase SppA [Verrucomicrobiota bacterium]
MQQNRKCSHAGFWVTITLLAIFLVLSMAVSFGLFAALAAKGGGGRGGDKGQDEFPELTEKWSYGSGDVKAVRIPVEGVIFRENGEGFFGTKFDKIEAILRQIRCAQNDTDVKAIILEVDSPGGDLTASDEIYQALRNFKASAGGRKVVAFFRDLAASGGYYISMPADWIIAEPTTLIGSIGVIMQTLNWKGLSEKIGVTDTTIKSATNKDLLNPFHDVPPEQIEILQNVIDHMHERFCFVVGAARKLDPNRLDTIADGRVFTADASLGFDLIDQIGYWDEVVAKTAELLGKPTVKVVRYEYRPGFFELLEQARWPLSRARWAEAQTPRLMYLWRP